jgi:hypothetical protein
MCHLATPSNVDFSSWNTFSADRTLINTQVCVKHTMPHAEYPYKTFWSKDTGTVFLPGMLTGSMGDACPAN